MECDVKLTADEFKEVHNALYHLNCLDDKKVDEQVDKIRTALASAYEQEHNAYKYKTDEADKIAKEFNLTSIWSVEKAHSLADTAPWQAQRVSYTNHWGDKEIIVDIDKTVNITWLDLWIAADKAITLSGDHHHIFVESFTPNSNMPGTLTLSTGS